jgi:SpoIID/LytB domain protein
LTIYRDEIRYALGVKSTVFDVATADESRERVVVSFPGGGGRQIPAGSRAGGYRRSISFDEAPAMYRLSNGAVFTMEILVPEQIIFRGRGVGHGVGMSQWGAQGMALAGEGYEAILKHFFTGIELTQAG